MASASSRPADRRGLVERLGVHLRAAMQIEAELVYSALDGLVDDAALQAARLDHEHIEQRLRAVARRSADGYGLDQRVEELAETARAHIAFEEEQLFANGAAADTPALAERVAVRRAELLGE